MLPLADFMAKSVLTRPDDVKLTVVEGATSMLIELRVHDEDVPRLRHDRSKLLRAMQVVLNAASGPQKAVLDLVEEGAQRARSDEE